MKSVVTEDIPDIEYSYYCAGKSKCQTDKIQYTVRLFTPHAAHCYFKEAFKHIYTN